MPVQGNLAPNWSFINWAGVPADPTGFTVTRVDGGGVAVVEEDNADFVFNGASCHMTTNDAGASSTLLTTTAIPINHLHRYILSLRHLRTDGTLTVTVNEYTALDALIGVAATANYAAGAGWNRRALYINETGGGGDEWDASAALARIEIECSGVDQDHNIDGLVFGDAAEGASAAFGTVLFWNGEETAELSNIGISMSGDSIDVSSHESADGLGDRFREFIPGLKDAGEVTMEGNYIPADVGQAAIEADYEAHEVRRIHIFAPNGIVDFEVDAFVTRLEISAPHDGKLSFSGTFKVDGAPVLATV